MPKENKGNESAEKVQAENIAIYIDKVSKSYGRFVALDRVELAIERGEMFGLIGSNGAGKSTLTKIMAGFLSPDKGNIYYYGVELSANYNEMKKYIGIVPQEVSFYHTFSVKENLNFFASLYGLKGEERRKRVNILLEWFDLTKFRKMKAEHLSGGYKRLLNIACALVNDPPIIFMDEPTVGLDPGMRQLFWEKIKKLKEGGKTICLTTHYMDEAEQLCTKIAIIDKGRVLMRGRPQDLINQFGGRKILVIKLSQQPSEELIAELRGAIPDSEVNVSGMYVVMALPKKHSLENMTKITIDITKRGFDILSTTIKEPKLEDVFLNLAGRKIEE
jgi:ABC-2 type transport system ATP-binding protein